MKKNKLNVEFVSSSEPSKMEDVDFQPLVDLCVLLIEIDRNQHLKKLKEGPQFCDYCGKEITKLSDFYSKDEKNICLKCYEKLSSEPGYQETFCGFKVAK